MPWKGLVPPGATLPENSWKRSVHDLSASEMIRELYQLLTMINADEKLVASFEQNMTVLSSREDPLYSLRLAVIEPTVTKLLVDSAAKNRWRADMEIDVSRDEGRPNPQTGPWSVVVGRLRIENGGWEPLTLRESCNKIIHADDIQPEFVVAGGQVPHLTGLIRSTGRLGGKKWEAEIDITNYVRASLFNIYGGIDFTRGWIKL
jgi:hypothetical protein